MYGYKIKLLLIVVTIRFYNDIKKNDEQQRIIFTLLQAQYSNHDLLHFKFNIYVSNLNIISNYHC